MSKLRKLVTSLLVVCTVITCGFANSAEASSVYGNSNSNISNGGYAADRGDYSYVRGSKVHKETDENNYYYIYRTYNNGSNKKTIVNNAADQPYINVVGSYIYYVGVYNGGNSLGIYRVKTDGTGRTRLIGNYDYNPIIVKDNKLFYIKETETDDFDSKSQLRVYDLKNRKTVSTLYTTTRYISDMSLAGDYIYITANGYENAIIYKIKTTDKSRTTLLKYEYGEEIESYIDNMVYYKGNIYYTIYNDKRLTDINDDTSEIYKISSTGKNNKLLSKYFTTGINLYNDKIYYTNMNNSICSMNLDGSNRKTIKKANGDYEWQYGINIAKSRIYYGKLVVDEDDTFEGILSDNIYRMTLTGKSTTKM